MDGNGMHQQGCQGDGRKLIARQVFRMHCVPWPSSFSHARVSVREPPVMTKTRHQGKMGLKATGENKKRMNNIHGMARSWGNPGIVYPPLGWFRAPWVLAGGG